MGPSSIESLEIEPIVGNLKEGTIRFGKEVFPLVHTLMDYIREIPHGFKLPFLVLILGLVVNED